MSRMKRVADGSFDLHGAAAAHPMHREAGQPPHRAAAPREAMPPTSEPLQANRGEHEREYIDLVLTDGGVKQMPIRRASENKVFHDWCTATANVDGFLRFNGYEAFTDEDIARAISAHGCGLNLIR